MTGTHGRLDLDLVNRSDDCHASIHARDAAHYEIATVVVRMSGDPEDSPELVQFANNLVNRYNEHDKLVQQIELLRNVCAEAYQMAGALDAPEKALDNLLAAAKGDPLPNESFLPVPTPDVISQRDELLSALKLAVEQMKSNAVLIEGEWGCDRDLDELELAGLLPETILKARAAIAKAKGGAS